MHGYYHHSMRTTITLDKDVAAKLKAEVRQTGRSFKEVVNKFLRLGLNTKKEKGSPKAFRVRAKALGVRDGLNYDNIGDLLEQVEGPMHK